MNRRLLMVFLIDALGHRQTSESGAFAFLPFENGPVASVCGFSSACIPSLLTGRLPVDHGHWNMYLRDPEHSVFRRYKPVAALVGGLLRRRYLARRIIARQLRKRIEGYFSLYEVPLHLLAQFDLCEKANLYAPGSLAPWQTPFDAAEKRGLAWNAWDWRIPETERRALFTQEVYTGRASFLFYYSPLLDGLAHHHGTRSREALECQRDLARYIEKTVGNAHAIYDEVRTIVCGDHGMADVHAVHDLLAPLASLPYRVPEDFLYFADATMIRVWYFREGIRQRVEALLASAGCGRVLDDEECRRLGILFPDRRYGETLFLADPGRMLAPSFMGTSPLRAMHGYHPGDVDSHTVVFSDFPHAPVASIRDVGPLVTAQIETWAGEGARPAGPAPRPGRRAGRKRGRKKGAAREAALTAARGSS